MSAESSSKRTQFLLLTLAATAVVSPGLAVGNSPPPVVIEGYVDAGDGVQLWFQRLGDSADPLIVLHGGPGLTLKYLADDLSPLARDRSVIFYDQRGAGRSTLVADAAALDAERFADDLEAVRQHFGLERVTLVGHSWGAGVAALYAMRYPDRVSRIGAGRSDGVAAQRAGSLFRRRASKPRTGRSRAAPGGTRRGSCRSRECRGRAVRSTPSGSARSLPIRQHDEARGDVCAGSPEALRNGTRRWASHDGIAGRLRLARLAPARRAPVLVLHGSEDVIPASAAAGVDDGVPQFAFAAIGGCRPLPLRRGPRSVLPGRRCLFGGRVAEGSAKPGTVTASPSDHRHNLWVDGAGDGNRTHVSRPALLAGSITFERRQRCV